MSRLMADIDPMVRQMFEQQTRRVEAQELALAIGELRLAVADYAAARARIRLLWLAALVLPALSQTAAAVWLSGDLPGGLFPLSVGLGLLATVHSLHDSVVTNRWQLAMLGAGV